MCELNGNNTQHSPALYLFYLLFNIFYFHTKLMELFWAEISEKRTDRKNENHNDNDDGSFVDPGPSWLWWALTALIYFFIIITIILFRYSVFYSAKKRTESQLSVLTLKKEIIHFFQNMKNTDLKKNRV